MGHSLFVRIEVIVMFYTIILLSDNYFLSGILTGGICN